MKFDTAARILALAVALLAIDGIRAAHATEASPSLWACPVLLLLLVLPVVVFGPKTNPPR